MTIKISPKDCVKVVFGDRSLYGGCLTPNVTYRVVVTWDRPKDRRILWLYGKEQN